MKYKDAIRYIWLRDNSTNWPREVCDLMENIYTKEQWDATIDAAIENLDEENNLYWNAVNFRTAAPEDTNKYWKELVACVNRLIATELETCAMLNDECAKKIRARKSLFNDIKL